MDEGRDITGGCVLLWKSTGTIAQYEQQPKGVGAPKLTEKLKEGRCNYAY
jgi:hypothetical protein